MSAAELHYTDRRGTHRIARGTLAELSARLPTLRRPARLEIAGRVVGRVEPIDGRSDDRRVRWFWWCDAANPEMPA